MRLGNATLPPFESNDGGYVGADAAGYQLLLDFRGGEFARYTLREVISGALDADAVRDKIILIGVTADSVKDYFQIPIELGVESSARVFGIAMHAHLASQLLRAALDGERPMTAAADWREALWILAWSLIGAAIGFQCARSSALPRSPYSDCCCSCSRPRAHSTSAGGFLRFPPGLPYDILSRGTIMRVEPSPSLNAKLARATPDRLPFIYAEEGLWYDAITTVSDLIAANPGNDALRAQRTALLEQVGLKAVVMAERTSVSAK